MFIHGLRGAALVGVAVGTLSAVAAAQNMQSIPSGIRASANGVTLEITALRDDIVRVREGKDGAMPADASWAVLPASRTSHTDVTAESDGFETKDLKVSVDAQLRITVSDLQGHVLQQDAQPIRYDGKSFRIYKKLENDEHFFGLGDKVGPLDRRGMAFVDWNTDIGWSAETDPIYKSIPFFYSWRKARVLGVLFDNTWRASFDFGKQFADQYQFGSVDGPVDYYLIYGPSPKQVVEDYAWLTGPTPLPPMWSLGYQQSRYSYYPESRVKEIARHLRQDKIPADVIWLDIDYQQNNRPFTVNKQRFPTFKQMIADLKKDNFQTVVISDLHIADLPDAGYKPYDEGVAQDRFVKTPDGKRFVGWVWPGNSVFPDFTEASTRAWYGSLYKMFTDDGVAGFWNDMNEPSVFKTATGTMPNDLLFVISGDQEFGFKDRTADASEIHNVLGMLQTEGTREGVLKLRPKLRPFVLTRASYAGGQRYSNTWTGDNSSTWKHLQMTTPQILNLGLSGFAMTGADVGGFLGSPQKDLLVKWFEIGAFQPIDRDHTCEGTKNQEPWVVGPKEEAVVRRYINTRYKLMPYLYTTAKTMSETGLPITRPLFLEFPEATTDLHPLDLDQTGEFLFGPDLLVAPPVRPSEVDDYNVILPKGDWYDYWTGKKVDRSKKLTITPTIDELPVYARGGSVIPEQPLVQSTSETPVGPLTLRVYPGAADKDGHTCSGHVYLDDGLSYDYEKGAYVRMSAYCTAKGIHISAHDGSYKPWWHKVAVELYGWKGSAAPKATAEGKALVVSREAGQDAWKIVLPDEGKGADIELR